MFRGEFCVSFRSNIYVTFGGDVLGSPDSIDDNDLRLNDLTLSNILTTSDRNDMSLRSLRPGLMSPILDSNMDVHGLR
jgi:hypothetical protein